MHEAAVAITDFVLAAECALFAFLTARKMPKSSYVGWLVLFFVSIAVGALFGGLMHGFFPDGSAIGGVLWLTTMPAIGFTALACWNLGADVLHKRWPILRAFAVIAFFAYVGIIVEGVRAYLLVIINYLPAALFLLVACLIAWQRGERALRWAAIGLILTFVAAAIQVGRIALPFIDHNALYHVVQAVALLLIFMGLVQREVRQG